MTNPGGGLNNIADPSLSWETNYTYNIAAEFGFWDQRLYGTVEYFNRDSKDLLQDVPVSYITGFSSSLKNVGEVNNKGLEIELGGDIIRTKDLTWSASLTASFIKSEVVKLYGGQDIIWYDPTGGDNNSKFIYREGESMLALYGLEWAGTNKENGKNMWYINPKEGENYTADLEINGRPVTYNYKKANETVLHDMMPKVYGGFNTDVNWKGLSVGLNFTYRFGSKTYDAADRDCNDDGYYWERTMSKTAYKDSWTPTNTNAKYPQRIAWDMEDVNQRSSRHLHNGDYIRLKTISIGYNLPKSIVSKAGLSSARVYFNGSNLLTWAAHKEYDPEVNAYYTRAWETPIGKTYTFGVELSF